MLRCLSPSSLLVLRNYDCLPKAGSKASIPGTDLAGSVKSLITCFALFPFFFPPFSLSLPSPHPTSIPSHFGGSCAMESLTWEKHALCSGEGLAGKTGYGYPISWPLCDSPLATPPIQGADIKLLPYCLRLCTGALHGTACLWAERIHILSSKTPLAGGMDSYAHIYIDSSPSQ